MRSIAPVLSACFSIGLLIGAVVNRIGVVRNRVVGAGSILEASQAQKNLESTNQDPSKAGPNRTSHSYGMHGEEYLIIDDQSGLVQTPVYNFGRCSSPQRNVLSSDGFELIDVDETGPAEFSLPPCGVVGLNGTLLVLTPMHNRAHWSKGELAIDRYFRYV
eukprot:SAG31_NODE_1139_length_9713_cov_28.936863_3_plen_161_part_00